MFISLCGLCALGFYSISLHRDGLEARRQADFTAVAEQIRLDVKQKLDEFIQKEHKRPYTDYQYYFVPVAANEAEVVMRSPLGDNLHHGLAYGHFQIEPDGTIINPFYQPERQQQPNFVAETYIKNVKQNLFAALDVNGSAGVSIVTRGIGIKTPQVEKEKDKLIAKNISSSKYEFADSSPANLPIEAEQKKLPQAKQKKSTQKGVRRSSRKGQSYKIPLAEEQQAAQVIEQSRFNIERNIDNTMILSRQARNARQTANQSSTIGPEMMMQSENAMGSSDMQGRDRLQSRIQTDMPAQQAEAQQFIQLEQQGDFDTETVQIRIEPFMTIVTPGDDGQPLFPGQVFLLRHIQIEQKHFLQGFRLDEAELIRQVEDSAWRFKRRDMDFDIGCEENPNAAHTAILDPEPARNGPWLDYQTNRNASKRLFRNRRNRLYRRFPRPGQPLANRLGAAKTRTKKRRFHLRRFTRAAYSAYNYTDVHGNARKKLGKDRRKTQRILYHNAAGKRTSHKADRKRPRFLTNPARSKKIPLQNR